MRFDSYGCIVTEGADPGNLGDSSAETSRHAVLSDRSDATVLAKFVSTHGFLRHPDAPYGPPRSLSSWRESDASSDQVFPLLMACDENPSAYLVAEDIRQKLKKSWRVAPGQIAAPVLMALVYRQYWLMKRLTDIQTLIFKVPWRWSDSKKRFERTETSSADFLNYFVSIYHLSKRGIKVECDTELILRKVESYYAGEPESKWIVDLYRLRLLELAYPNGTPETAGLG